LQRGLPLGDGLHLSGKIDRIDVDPFSARGIVQDYKSGRTAHSAKQIDEELKLQIPLYMLVLRDLVGIEPLGGVYRALAGAGVTRGLLLTTPPTTCPATRRTTTCRMRVLGDRQASRERAHGYAQLPFMQATSSTTPRGGACPVWCDLWTMCRIERS
jgi:RecB family exonuclease